jgi:D-glucuronyl C5-epimerase C-terminus
MKSCLATIIFISLALASRSWADDGSLTSVHVTNSYPVVSFDVVEPDLDGQLKLPDRTPNFSPFLDDHEVYAIHIGDGIARHIAIISAQASGMSSNDLDLLGAFEREKSLTRPEEKALDWLKENRVPIDGKAVVWHYTFDHTLNNIVIKSGWPSAFAQADVIKALILAYWKTHDAAYLALATNAGFAFTVPCEHGGIRCEVGGIPWFEEFPVPYGFAPMILNAHLYSVVMLHHLYTLNGDRRIHHAFEEGVASAKRMLLRFDTGYWSIYQVRPRALNVMLVLASAVPDTEIREVSVSSAVSEPSVLRLGPGEVSTFPGNGWGEGWGNASSWGRNLNGIGRMNLLPGRLTIDHDPVNVSVMDIAVRYRSPGCVVPTLATYDYRASSTGFMKILAGDYGDTGETCVGHFSLPDAINQWSQIDAFYHDWHTRLVAELWRITKDPEFYTTAIRWRRYASAEQKLKNQTTEGTISTPIFVPHDGADEDEDIMEALNAADPATMSDDDVANRLRDWLRANCVPPEMGAHLISRAGLSLEHVKPPTC